MASVPRPRIYSRQFLLSLRQSSCHGLSRNLRRRLFYFNILDRFSCSRLHLHTYQIPTRTTIRRSVSNKRQNSPPQRRHLIRIKFASIPRRSNQVCRTPAILLANLRSINNKFDEVALRISNLKPDIAVFTESWLEAEVPDHSICVPSFNLFRLDRTGTRGGGILCYISQCLSARAENDNLPPMTSCQSEFLCIFVKEFTLFLIILYHPFWNDAAADEDAISYLTQAVDFAHITYGSHCNVSICGDFNDLRHRYDLISRLTETRPTVTFSTRGENTLDQIFTNYQVIRPPKRLPPIGNSDHATIFCPGFSKERSYEKVVTRKFTNNNVAKFKRMMYSTNWMEIISTTSSLDDSSVRFLRYLEGVYNSCFPKRIVRLRDTDPPWMKPSLKIRINDRDKAFTQGKHAKYRRLRDDVTRHIKHLKALHIREAEFACDSKKTWQTIHSISRNKRRRIPLPGVSATDFSDYFASTFSKNNATRDSDTMLSTSLTSLPNHPLFLRILDVERLLKKIKRKSAGPDGVPYWVLRDFASVLAPAVTVIFNRSLELGVMPACFKEAYITPVPKSSNCKLVSDYRPISLLPLLSKVLEKIVSTNWIKPYFQDTLSSSQFAYIPGSGKGATCALTLMNHRILKFLDSSSGAVRILSIDYAKAFDRLPHSAIIDSIIDLKLPRQAVIWIHSFLTNRTQSVRVAHEISESICVPSGVPQGSVLGPLLFCAVIDKLSAIFPNTDTIKYADDITLLHYVRTPNDDHLNEEWSNITTWSACVGLPINMAKCSILDIATKKDLLLRPVAGVPKKDSVRILGIVFSSNLSWREHIDSAVTKASKRMFVLRNLRRSGCPVQIMHLVYSCLVRSVLLYAFPAFCNIPEYLYDKIRRVERRAARIVGQPFNVDLVQSADALCNRLFDKVIRSADHSLRELFLCRQPTIRNPCVLRPPLTRTKRLKNSFIKYCHL